MRNDEPTTFTIISPYPEQDVANLSEKYAKHNDPAALQFPVFTKIKWTVGKPYVKLSSIFGVRQHQYERCFLFNNTNEHIFGEEGCATTKEKTSHNVPQHDQSGEDPSIPNSSPALYTMLSSQLLLNFQPLYIQT